MEESGNVIDLKRVIRNGNSRFLKSLPNFIVELMIRIVKQNEFNEVINHNADKVGVPFIDGILHDWNVKVECLGAENIPREGRFIFASNHPLGGIDALSFYHMVYAHFTDVVSPANELLNLCPNLRPLVFGVNVFGKVDREIARKLDELYESDTQIMIFPAGEVSRRQKGIISDIPWQKSFVSKAVQHRRDIIPVFISGRNSNLFYNVASLRKRLGIRMYVETMLLPGEMLKQKNSSVQIIIGKPITYQTFTTDKTHTEWAQWVKSIVYSIPDQIKKK